VATTKLLYGVRNALSPRLQQLSPSLLSHSYELVHSPFFWNGVVVSVAMALASMLLGINVQISSREQAARSVYLLVNFVMMLDYTLVILDSRGICAVLGMSQADSGLVVGIYQNGLCSGAFNMACFAKGCPSLWRHSGLPIIQAALTRQLLASAAYCFISVQATHMAHGANFR